MQRLAQGGVVATRRGGGGDAVLAHDPRDVTIGAVVRLLEDGQPLVECFAATGGDCTITGCCRLKMRLRSAEAAFLAVLDQSSLALRCRSHLQSGARLALCREASHPDLWQRKAGSEVVSIV